MRAGGNFLFWLAAGLLLAGMVMVSGCAPLAIGAGAGAGYKMATDERTLGRQLDDTNLAIRVKAALGSEESVPARRIDVDVVRGIVHLSGFVESEEIRQRAGQVSGEVSGVSGVRNNLKLGSRTWGQAFDDRRLGARVKTALMRDSEIRAMGIDVDVYLSRVFLNGVVSSAAQKQRVGEVAAGVEGVAGVSNQLLVDSTD